MPLDKPVVIDLSKVGKKKETLISQAFSIFKPVVTKDKPELVSITLPKEELYHHMARRVLLGDHDVNPANFMLSIKNGQANVCSIDFGHGFCDLIKQRGQDHSPQGLEKGESFVANFFNRQELSGMGGAKEPKFWRDYQGIVTDPKFAEVMFEEAQAVIDGKDGLQAMFIDTVKEKLLITVKATALLKWHKEVLLLYVKE